MRVLARGLDYPEGPVVLGDGSVAVVEVRGGTIAKVAENGEVTRIAVTGGGPNGAALGPDGALYVCNNGGLEFAEQHGLTTPGHQAHDYAGGSIQRVDLETGEVRSLYESCDGVPLKGPNDIVFDPAGGFWFTDHGQTRARDRDRTGIFYAAADGSAIREAAFPLDAPNGIGLSPDGTRLYVAETFTGRLWEFALSAPGAIEPFPSLWPGHGGRLLASLGPMALLDSLAVDGEGNISVATLLDGGITTVSPSGEVVDRVSFPDPLTTNICFGGPGRRQAYVTLSGTGQLAVVDWPRAGAALAWELG